MAFEFRAQSRRVDAAKTSPHCVGEVARATTQLRVNTKVRYYLKFSKWEFLNTASSCYTSSKSLPGVFFGHNRRPKNKPASDFSSSNATIWHLRTPTHRVEFPGRDMRTEHTKREGREYTVKGTGKHAVKMPADAGASPGSAASMKKQPRPTAWPSRRNRTSPSTYFYIQE